MTMNGRPSYSPTSKIITMPGSDESRAAASASRVKRSRTVSSDGVPLVEQLDRDGAAEDGVGGAVDLAHPADRDEPGVLIARGENARTQAIVEAYPRILRPMLSCLRCRRDRVDRPRGRRSDPGRRRSRARRRRLALRSRRATRRWRRRSTPCRRTCSSTTRTPRAVKGTSCRRSSAGSRVVVGSSGLSAADYDEIDARGREQGRRRRSRPATSRSRPRCSCASRGRRRATSRRGRSSTTRASASRTRRAAPPASSPSGSAACGRPRSRCRSRRRSASATPAGRRSRGHRCTRCACRASRSRPRSSSRPRASGCRSATTRAENAAPYVAGTLLAIRAVPALVGLTRGLDQLLS